MTKIIMEKLWAKNKYELMMKGYNYYKEIQALFRQADTDKDYYLLFQRIKEIKRKPFNHNGVITTTEHLWGYFKLDASPEEKEHFFSLLNNLKQCNTTQYNYFPKEVNKLLGYIVYLLDQYETPYLENSTLFLPKGNWNRVILKEKEIIVSKRFFEEGSGENLREWEEF
ncbi:DUF1722 domain-containing protein [Evansella tamaricis]|uniref:YbgA family protein n=1 Tax=Evansella tamaricis TaxID=2069301 RepID=A0ABS6JDW7_9BACI|nr:DUF1722 domain-containing protein [Evansella tamaricis]MBU9711399.1 YbgA family protein [Evansella tamaricis]